MGGARKLREILARAGIIRSIAAHDVLSAMIIERAGAEMTFVGGFGASACLHGLPDLSFLGIAEMAEAVRRVTGRVSIPVVADGDTGHGDLHNVWRCVRELERAGAAGIILEDQVFPKRCGHFEGKAVIPAEDMVLKLKAALAARASPDLVLFARTDARGPLGIDEAIDRANRYCDAGADVAFIEAPMSSEELELVARRVPHPKMANMLPFGKTPILPARELEAMGFKIVVASIDSVLLVARAVRDLAEEFLREGSTASLQDRMLGLEELKRVLGVDGFLSLGENLGEPPGGPYGEHPG